MDKIGQLEWADCSQLRRGAAALKPQFDALYATVF